MLKNLNDRMLFIHKKNFKLRIILPTVVILIALVLTMSIFQSVRFLKFGNYLVSKKLVTDTNNLELYIDNAKRYSRAAAASMAVNPNAIRLIKGRNANEIARFFNSKLDLYQVSYFTICDNNGIVLARTYDPEAFDDSVLNQQNIKDALSGKISTYFESGTLVKASIRTGAPVYDIGGALIGAVSAGFRFDLDSKVDELKELFGSEVTIFYGDKIVATTITKSGERILGETLDPQIAKIVIENKQKYFDDQEDIHGKKHKVFYMPLLNANNEVFATFVIAIPIDELTKMANTSIKNGVIIGLIGLIVSIVLLYYIVSSISAPIVALSNDMENVADGNLNININVVGVDEISRLSTSLKKVIDTVQKLVHGINSMITEHSKGNIDYRIDTENFYGAYKTLADQVLELANFSMKDQLTGLLNRRSFNNRLDLEWGRAIREKTPISILLVDVDRFKSYNDKYGHQQGDLALQTVAKTLSRSIERSVDLAARWGGEEFVVLLPNTDLAGALLIAERIRKEIENLVIHNAKNEATNVTVSIGAHTHIPDKDSFVDKFIFVADYMLYRAKETGRNKVVFHDNGTGEPLDSRAVEPL